MRLLDALVSGHFRQRRDGSFLFFPWKRLGKARVLPAEQGRRLRRRMGIGVAVLLPTVIAATALAPRAEAWQGGPAWLYTFGAAALVLGLFMAWYLAAVVGPTGAAQRSDEPLDPAEATLRTLRSLTGDARGGPAGGEEDRPKRGE